MYLHMLDECGVGNMPKCRIGLRTYILYYVRRSYCKLHKMNEKILKVVTYIAIRCSQPGDKVETRVVQ